MPQISYTGSPPVYWVKFKLLTTPRLEQAVDIFWQSSSLDLDFSFLPILLTAALLSWRLIKKLTQTLQRLDKVTLQSSPFCKGQFVPPRFSMLSLSLESIGLAGSKAS